MTQPQGQAEPLTAEQVNAITALLSVSKTKKGIRDWAMFRLMICTMLRSCDIVSLTIGDVRADDGSVRERLVLRQRKTHATVQCVLVEKTRRAIAAHLDTNLAGRKKGAKLFEIGTRQLRNRVKAWAGMLGLDPRHRSAHSLRRTKSSIIYAETGNLRIVQLGLGHSRISNTVSYLNVDGNKAMEVFGARDL